MLGLRVEAGRDEVLKMGLSLSMFACGPFKYFKSSDFNGCRPISRFESVHFFGKEKESRKHDCGSHDERDCGNLKISDRSFAHLFSPSLLIEMQGSGAGIHL